MSAVGGGGGLSNEDIFQTRIFGAKSFAFFEIYAVSAWTWGEGVEPVWIFFGKRCSSDVNVCTFWSKKLRICVRMEMGWASVDILRTRVEGVNFSRFCSNVFYGRALII